MVMKYQALFKKAIRPIIDGKDLIAQAQSGTGKTATFAIGSLSSIDVSLVRNSDYLFVSH